MVYNMTIFCDTSCHQLCTVVLSFLPYTTGKQQNDIVCDRSDKEIKPINIFQFVDMLLNWKFIETVVLLCRKAEQADRHIAMDYEPQGRHMEKRL